MNITEEKLTKLLTEIERVRRRKIVDFRTATNIEYIDTGQHLEKIAIKNNHLIFGRRGSGKTTLIIAALRENKKDIVAAIDIQPIKNYDKAEIIIEIMIKTFNELYSYFLKVFDITEQNYNRQYKGLSGLYHIILKKQNKDIKEQYNDANQFKSFLLKQIELLVALKDKPNVVTYAVTLEDKQTNEDTQKTSSKESIAASLDLGVGVQANYKILSGKINTNINILNSIEFESTSISNSKSSSNVKASYERTFRKIDVLKEQRESIAFIFNELKRINKNSVIVYLDDFYQIPVENQPEIIQYFHDIYKYCSDDSFCFKLSLLPYRVRMNIPGNVDMSYKDDFSLIKLDNDLSEIATAKEYLLSILSSLNSASDISKNDILSLFSNEEVLLFAIIATGGVPRDFLSMFAQLVANARSDNEEKIKKEHVYTVVKTLREDKDNNIETDSDISAEKIREAVEILTSQVIEKLKTNVILYPKGLAEKKHELLLKNLVNLRYLHVIKDSTSSETRKKEEFVAYLVDMSFYAVNKRLRTGFDFRRFWETDNSSRLTQLRQSRIWSFPDDFI